MQSERKRNIDSNIQALKDKVWGLCFGALVCFYVNGLLSSPECRLACKLARRQACTKQMAESGQARLLTGFFIVYF